MGRSLARGDIEPPPEDADEQLRALGIGGRLPTPRQMALPADAVDALELFLRCTTQWRYGPSGLPTGLDYAAVRAVAEWFATPRAAFDDLRLIEAGFLEEAWRSR